MGYFVEVERGVNIYVEDVGSGRPVLLIHGWPVDHRMYEYQTSQLPKYGFRCIQPDLRGYGKSDRPWTGYGYDRLADDVRMIIDALRLEQVKLVGFSMGGAVGIRYMSRHAGHRVSQLILAAAAAPVFTRRDDFPWGMARQEVDGFLAANDTDRPQMLRDFGKIFFAKPVSASFGDWFQSLGLKASSHGTAGGLISLRDEDLRPDLPRIHVPTWIFHGVEDRICPFPLAQAMHWGIRQSALVRFEHSGHGLFYDELQLFNHRLLTALTQGP